MKITTFSFLVGTSRYSCALWLIFHVLSVNQIEIEREKIHPFENEFKVYEIVEAIRKYVKYFYDCPDCVETFLKESSDYLRFLNKPYDGIQYLWKSNFN